MFKRGDEPVLVHFITTIETKKFFHNHYYHHYYKPLFNPLFEITLRGTGIRRRDDGPWAGLGHRLRRKSLPGSLERVRGSSGTVKWVPRHSRDEERNLGSPKH